MRELTHAVPIYQYII